MITFSFIMALAQVLQLQLDVDSAFCIVGDSLRHGNFRRILPEITKESIWTETNSWKSLYAADIFIAGSNLEVVEILKRLIIT